MLQEQANVIANTLSINDCACSSSGIPISKRNYIVAGTICGESNAVCMQIVDNWI
jgi:hypothetical protein